ncbi:restriction endonuclease subunit S [Campylobacter devanensis]|uniref:restriction endonuclease subunit S n=1 Tax=Campylobacter devanensis TaxID=3161138 RepID=UPI001F023012|nr:restriction endonuclease subunit S [Campylobacter sp. P0138]
MENTWIYGKNKQYSTIFKENVKNSIPVISGITINNGVNYYTTDTLKDNEVFSDCLTISTRGEYSGTVTYHKGKFALANNILTMPLNDKWSEKSKLFFAALINNLGYGGYSGYPRKETLKNDIIKLPITASGEIDFEFMESFVAELEAERVAELEAERVAELEAYLAAASLKDYKLTADELSALSKFENYNWGEFRIGDLFDVSGSKTTSKSYLEKIGKGDYPYITTQAINNGIAGFYNYFTEQGNCLTIDSAVLGTCFWQNKNFSASDHVEILRPKNFTLNQKIALFFISLLNKNASILGYSYAMKRNQSRIKNENIKLPITTNGEIDFEFMNNFIKAIKKLVIKDVVLYTDNKIKATKSIVSSNQ